VTLLPEVLAACERVLGRSILLACAVNVLVDDEEEADDNKNVGLVVKKCG
jgi:hypothetical protein